MEHIGNPMEGLTPPSIEDIDRETIDINRNTITDDLLEQLFNIDQQQKEDALAQIEHKEVYDELRTKTNPDSDELLLQHSQRFGIWFVKHQKDLDDFFNHFYDTEPSKIIAWSEKTDGDELAELWSTKAWRSTEDEATEDIKAA